MGPLTSLRGKLAGVDTSPSIYFIEEHPKYVSVVDPFFESVERGEISVVTSRSLSLKFLSCRCDPTIALW